MVELINHPQLKAEDLKTAATLFSKKLHAGFYYKPNTLYSGELMLIKVKDSFVDLKKDYGLAEVIITNLNTTHPTLARFKVTLSSSPFTDLQEASTNRRAAGESQEPAKGTSGVYGREIDTNVNLSRHIKLAENSRN